jgi:hypothetical protein
VSLSSASALAASLLRSLISDGDALWPRLDPFLLRFHRRSQHEMGWKKAFCVVELLASARGLVKIIRLSMRKIYSVRSDLERKRWCGLVWERKPSTHRHDGSKSIAATPRSTQNAIFLELHENRWETRVSLD